MRELLGHSDRVRSSPALELDDASLAKIEIVYGSLGRMSQAHRPWLVINMIQSIDGGITVDGVSGGLGGPADRAVFRALRRQAPMILVGAATVRSEVYRPARCPIAVVSATGEFGAARELREHPTTLVLCSNAATIDDFDESRIVRSGDEDFDFVGALATMSDRDVPWILCEGGPRINGQLLALDLVDEVCVTIAPVTLSGTSSRIAGFQDSVLHSFELASAIEHDSMLLLRYLRHPADTARRSTQSALEISEP